MHANVDLYRIVMFDDKDGYMGHGEVKCCDCFYFVNALRTTSPKSVRAGNEPCATVGRPPPRPPVIPISVKRRTNSRNRPPALLVDLKIKR
jgi:hypothetical protein